jgi:hypothetical protein
VSLNERGKRRRQYKIADYRTTFEKLKLLERAEQYLKDAFHFDEVADSDFGLFVARIRRSNRVIQSVSARVSFNQPEDV